MAITSLIATVLHSRCTLQPMNRVA
uniref:Uncharacterized protein n=1 Tax=Arundo donax TaxID=35708 RepID=A0A0A9B8A4_ARUDO